MLTIQRSAPENKGARQIRARLFQTYWVHCHGSDMHGSKGFPNLVDNHLLYPGTPDGITTSIFEGCNGMMPALADVLKPIRSPILRSTCCHCPVVQLRRQRRRAVTQHSNSFSRLVMALEARAWSHWARLT